MYTEQHTEGNRVIQNRKLAGVLMLNFTKILLLTIHKNIVVYIKLGFFTAIFVFVDKGRSSRL